MNLHLGCGPIHLSGFVNIDHEASHNPDVCMDYLGIAERFGEGSASLIFSCHSIEHLAYPAGVVQFFKQAFTTLKPHGTIRLVVPDLMKVAKMYVRGESMRDIYDGPYYAYKDCPAERFMFFARGWSHTVLFDEQLLTMLLQDAGFVNIRVMSFGQSDVSELRGHDRFATESLSLEATKP